MQAMVPEALGYLKKNDMKSFGRLLHESWLLKKSLSDRITTSFVDEVYEKAMKAGALGGKLLGAGGGGFVLIFAEPARQKLIKEKMKKLLLVPFTFEDLGSQIIFYQPDEGR